MSSGQNDRFTGISQVRRVVMAALLFGLGNVCLPLPQAAFAGNHSGGCCCTCENSTTCSPACFVTNAEDCEAACQGAGCGPAMACPDPSAGGGCSVDTVSCVQAGTPISTATATATATTTSTPTATSTRVPNGGACMDPSDCASGNCVNDVCVGAAAAAPAASNGGLVAMTIALVIAAFIALRWRRA